MFRIEFVPPNNFNQSFTLSKKDVNFRDPLFTQACEARSGMDPGLDTHWYRNELFFQNFHESSSTQAWEGKRGMDPGQVDKEMNFSFKTLYDFSSTQVWEASVRYKFDLSTTQQIHNVC